MDAQALKEPRGFIRCLEWIFALAAFTTCVNFSTNCGYTITCMASPSEAIQIVHPIQYPFKLDELKTRIIKPQNVSLCFDVKKAENQPGDFQSNAEFFVFTGVITWLGSTAWLIVYLFFCRVELRRRSAAQRSRRPRCC